MGVLATDDFNRADDSTTPSGLGAGWTLGIGEGQAFGIGTNAATIISSSGSYRGAYYSAETAPDDQYSQASVVALTNSQHLVTVRSATAGTQRNYYGAGVWPNEFGGATTTRICKALNNVYTSLGTGSTAAAAGQTWYLEVQGSDLVMKVDGSTEISTTDASHTSGQFGIAGGHSGTDNYRFFDDWEGGDFSSGVNNAVFYLRA